MDWAKPLSKQDSGLTSEHLVFAQSFRWERVQNLTATQSASIRTVLDWLQDKSSTEDLTLSEMRDTARTLNYMSAVFHPATDLGGSLVKIRSTITGIETKVRTIQRNAR